MQVLLNNMNKVNEFVSIVSHSNCDVDLGSGKNVFIDAKSLLGILSCDISKPLFIDIIGDSTDRNSLLTNISSFIIND